MRCGMIGTIFIAVCIYRNVFSLWQLSVYHPADGDIVLSVIAARRNGGCHRRCYQLTLVPLRSRRL
jgi:hypothetical protein